MKSAKFRLTLVAFIVSFLIAASPAAADMAQKHFLWKLTGGASGGTAYLLGTIHVGVQELYPLPPVIETAFAQSDVLIEELDPTKSGELQHVMQDMLATGVYHGEDSVEHHLSPKTREQLAAYIKTNSLGADYTRLKPWLLSLLLMQARLKQLGLDQAKGLDVHFVEEATKAHKPIEALETADFQIKLFSSFNDSLQDQLLMTTLLDAQKATQVMDLMLEAWRAGDADAMDGVITREVRLHPFLQPVMEKLLYERNETMAQRIAAFLKPGKTCFVAVGAGHLVGARGIISLLRAHNFAVEQL